MLCLCTVSAVLMQRAQLAGWRTSHQIIGEAVQSPAGPAADQDSGAASQGSLSDGESRELMHFRAEVTTLTARKRALASVAETSERLRAQLAIGATNSDGVPLPAGFIRKAEARFVGYGTPENAVQSWLWAIQHHDFGKLIEALSPGAAQHMQAQLEEKGDPDKFFKGLDSIAGLAVQGRQVLPDGSVELQVYIAPGLPPQKMQLQLLEGEWKMDDF